MAGLLTRPSRRAFPALHQWQVAATLRGLTAAGTVPDSHRIPFSPALRWTPWRYNFILFQTVHIITRIGKESTGEIDSFPRSAAAFPGENARKRESARRTQGPPGALGVPQEITA